MKTVSFPRLVVAFLLLFLGSTNVSVASVSGNVVSLGRTLLPNIPVATQFTNIAAGTYHNLAVRNDGTVVAWGDNFDGTCVVPNGLSGVVAIAAGHYWSMALQNNGNIVGWGKNNYGQATIPSGLSGVVAIKAGTHHGMVLKTDGTVIAWGNNDLGQTNVPPGLSGVLAIAAGTYHSLALKNNGSVVAWGNNGNGQTNVPSGLNSVVAVAGGSWHTMVLKSNGTVVAWGSNSNGQTNVPTGLSGVIAIAAGYRHNVALKNDGTVVAWGDNAYEQRAIPSGLSGVVAISANANHSLARKSDGTIVAWGENASLQGIVPNGYTEVSAVAAGDGHSLALKNNGTVIAWGNTDYGQSTVPVGLNGVIAVACGYYHSMALKNNGTVVAWGNNTNGQRTVPSGLSGVVGISAGAYHSVALKSDGTIAAWGSNTNGERTIPVGLNAVVAISAGAYHNLALRNNGTVAAWGNNTSGQSTVPSGLNAVVAVSAGGYHSLALKNNGTVVAWGENGDGQRTIPSGLNGVVAIAAGRRFSMALKSNGTVVAWGRSVSGESTVPTGLNSVVGIASGYYHSLAIVGTTTPGSADLASSSLQFTPSTVSQGSSITISFRARNLSAFASPAAYARLRLSPSGILGATDPVLQPAEITIPSIFPLNLFDNTATFVVPTAILPGTYYLSVTIDPGHLMTDPNRANNIAISSTKLTVLGTGTPSLSVSPLSWTASRDAGLASFNIRNAAGGTLAWSAAIPSSTWIHFQGSSSGTAPQNGSMLTVVLDRNSSSISRTGSIVVSAAGATPSTRTITLSQLGTAISPVVSRIGISTIPSPQQANTPFPITLTAFDNSEPPVVQSAFGGAVDLRNVAGGSITPRYVFLSGGTWSGSVSINTPSASTTLQASRPLVGIQGESNPFTVEAPAAAATATITVQTPDKLPAVGANVTFQQLGHKPITAATDANGFASFILSGAGRCSVIVTKDAFANSTDNFPAEGRSIVRPPIRLRALGLRPVVLVPGMMGSYGGYAPGVASCAPWVTFPTLPSIIDSPEDLDIYDPAGLLGWGKLREHLEKANYAVSEAPWDWRIPPIRSSSSIDSAWDLYVKPVIDKAIEQSGYATVDIVAHSMGALLIRAYIDSGSYRGDIRRFAMVGPPNEGSANAYYLWFGGSPNGECFYAQASMLNYERWHPWKKWHFLTDKQKQTFYQTEIPSLEEGLPVYKDFLLGERETPASGFPYPGFELNPLFKLNEKGFSRYDKECAANKVCAKVFCSPNTPTISQIVVKLPRSQSPTPLYPHGTPVGKPIEGIGDGTVRYASAMMYNYGFPFDEQRSVTTSHHARLIGAFTEEIVSFITENEGGALSKHFSAKGVSVSEQSKGNELEISVFGRTHLWVIDPQDMGCGISPVDGAYTNQWINTSFTSDAHFCTLTGGNISSGIYRGTITGREGETLKASFGFTADASAFSTNISWIGSTNPISFIAQLATNTSVPLQVFAIPAPSNVRSFSSNNTCRISWGVAVGMDVSAYRIYGRPDNEPLFSQIGSTLALEFDTGREWKHGTNGTEWFFAVVAVSTNNLESPFLEVVENSSPTLARFTATALTGTSPLTVTFSDQSLGSVTNWAWDFDSDGLVDSTEQNPTTIFADSGSYSVTLTVSGPDGTDTHVEVGYVNVSRPVLSANRILPGGVLELVLYGEAGRNYELQTTTNLVAWTTLTNILTTNATTILTDPGTTNYTQRFYRVVVP